MVEANTKNRKKGENGGHITVYGLRMKMEQAGTILKSKQTNQISAKNDVRCPFTIKAKSLKPLSNIRT